jgi:hypothetical protein
MIPSSTNTPYYYGIVLCALFCPLLLQQHQPLQVTAFAPSASTTVHNHHHRHHHGDTLRKMAAADGSGISGPPYSGPAVKPILDSVTYPSDMKRLDLRQLKQVRARRKEDFSIENSGDAYPLIFVSDPYGCFRK